MLWLYIKMAIGDVSFIALPTGKGNGNRPRKEGLRPKERHRHGKEKSC